MVVMRLINLHLFNKQNHIDEEQLSRAGPPAGVCWEGQISPGTSQISLCPHHLVTLSAFVSGRKPPDIIYLAPRALVSNLLIRFEGL